MTRSIKKKTGERLDVNKEIEKKNTEKVKQIQKEIEK